MSRPVSQPFDVPRVERALRSYLGLGPRVPLELRVEAAPVRGLLVTVRSGDELPLGFFLSLARFDQPAWVRGPALALSYRSRPDGGDPMQEAGTRRLLAKLERRIRACHEAPAPCVSELVGVLQGLADHPAGSVSESIPAASAAVPAARQAASGRSWLEAMLTLTESQRELLLAAFELGAIDHLGAAAETTPEALGAACGLDAERGGLLLRALQALGVAVPGEGGGLGLAPTLPDLLPELRALLERRRQEARWWGQVGRWLREGRTAASTADHPAATPEIWARYIRNISLLKEPRPGTFDQRAHLLPLGAHRVLLDVGVGSGHIALDLMTLFPELTLIGVDYPPAVPIAQEVIARHGLAHRARVVAGAFYAPDWRPPPGFDVAWICGTIHVEGWEANLRLLRTLRAALPPGGRVLVDERVRGAGDWDSAHNDLYWSLGTPAGRAYTHGEIAELLAEAGFSAVETLWPPDPNALVSGRVPDGS